MSLAGFGGGWGGIVVVGLIGLIALLVTDDYLALVATYTVLWAIIASSWNIFSGYTGMVSFGHAVFWGLGGYAVTLALLHVGLSPWLGLVLAALVGAAAALVIGLPTLRLAGAYYGLSMLAYSLVMLLVFTWLGYQEVPLPLAGRDPLTYLNFDNARVYGLVALAVLVAVLVISVRIERGPMGRRLGAIKQDESAAEAAGVDAFGAKLRASMLSGAIAAVGGGLYVLTLSVALPESLFGLLVSAQAVVLTLFGGVGVVWGPVIGAAILVPLAQILNSELGQELPGIQGLVYGVALIATVIWAPDGLFWKIADWRRGRAGHKPARRDPDHLGLARPGLFAPPDPSFDKVKAVLELRNVSKLFGGLKALDDVTFEVRPQTIHGVIGPNGAGKTTLFNVINGFLRPNVGGIAFLDRNIVGLKPHEIHTLGLSRTFQVVRPFPRWSLLENVRIATLDTGLGPEETAELAWAALERVDLAQRADAAVSELTARELRLMEIARALAGRPRLILLDETLAGLARAETQEMVALIKSLKSEGITIVIIEHTMYAMVDLVDTLTVLDHGRKIAEGPPSEVVQNGDVIAAYLGTRWAANAGG